MRYKRTVLKNGIRLITVTIPNNPTVTVSATVNIGASYEKPEINGISHFLEHLQFKGTEKRRVKEISHQLDLLGAEYNAFTNYEVTSFYIKSSKKYFSKIADVLADVYQNSTFPKEEIEKERGVILEEINMYKDNNAKNLHVVLQALLYPNHPLGASVLGTKPNIKNLKREDFLDYRDEFYKGSATTVIVSGDINHNEAKKIIEEKFTALPKGKFTKPAKIKKNQKSPQTSILNKKTDQTHFALAFRSFDVYHKDKIVADVLRGILSAGMSSRLFTRMREELGICYYCYASSDYTFDSGDFGIYAGVNKKRLTEAIGAILEILKDIKENGVSKDELDKVKKTITGKIPMNLETSDDYEHFFLGREIFKKELEKPSHTLKKIKAVTEKDIKRVARKIFEEKNMNLAIVGPHKKEEKEIKKLLKI